MSERNLCVNHVLSRRREALTVLVIWIKIHLFLTQDINKTLGRKLTRSHFPLNSLEIAIE